jgi:hypothetical protein
MIQDGIDYGEWYEKATEPGPDVEFYYIGTWYKRDDPKENLCSEYRYRKPIKPKENDMNEKMIDIMSPIIPRPISYGSDCKSQYCIPLSEAIRLGEEAQRIKADNEIKAGDLFYTFGSIRKCFAWKNGEILDVDGQIHDKTKCKKIIDLTRPLNEIYEGMK